MTMSTSKYWYTLEIYTIEFHENTLFHTTKKYKYKETWKTQN